MNLKVNDKVMITPESLAGKCEYAIKHALNHLEYYKCYNISHIIVQPWGSVDIYLEETDLIDENNHFSAEVFVNYKTVKMTEVKVVGNMPTKATEGSAGYDLTYPYDEVITINPGERKLVKIGMFTEFPPNIEAQIRPRSGMAYKHGITVLNSPGTIDSDYRGEWGVILINLGNNPYIINKGDRIAQAVFSRLENIKLVSKEINKTSREGGFGSTGK